MKEKREVENIVAAVSHSRKGSALVIKNVVGYIEIVSRHDKERERSDAVDIMVNGPSIAHDHLQVQASKGIVQLTGPNADLPTPVTLRISVPSGITVSLEQVSGTVLISETVEVLTVVGDRPCRIYTELLHGAMLRIGHSVEMNIKRLLGHCDIVASESAHVEVREAHISTLSAIARGNARVSIHGSARFAKFKLERQAFLHIDNVEELIERHTDKKSLLDLGWIGPPRKTDEEERRNSVHQAITEMTDFVRDFTPRSIVIPHPLAAVNT